MVFSFRPLPALFSFHSLFGVCRIRPRSAIFGLFFPAPALGFLWWFFRAVPDPRDVAWFFGCRGPHPFMVFSAFPDFPEVARIPAGFFGLLPLVLRWFFWPPRIRLPGPKKLAKFPAPFGGFFGRSAGLGAGGPWAFHGFFGSPAPPRDPRILANFLADFRPAQPSSARFSRNFQGGFDCQFRISHKPCRFDRNYVIRTR